jgi:hypothetical protein
MMPPRHKMILSQIPGGMLEWNRVDSLRGDYLTAEENA